MTPVSTGSLGARRRSAVIAFAGITVAFAIAGMAPLPAWGAPPSTTITSGPRGSNPTNDNTPTFTFSSSQEGTFECRLDSFPLDFLGCPVSYTTPLLADGSHLLEVRAQNSVGEADPTPASRSFTVDTVEPDTKVALLGSGKRTRDRTPTAVITASESRTTLKCAVDSRPPRSCLQEEGRAELVGTSTAFTTPKLKPRTRKHVLRVTSTDEAGNIDATPAVLRFRVLGPKPSK